MTSSHDWTGSVGDTWAAEWRRTDRSLADLSRHLDAAILAAAPAAPASVLDIGCGAGATSLVLADARPDLTITGVDLSAQLVAVAVERQAERLTVMESRVRFIGGDVLTVAARHAPFDLLCSRHGVMFFDDPTAAFTALRRAAASVGRLVFSCFRDWSLNAFACDVAEAVGGTLPAPGPGPFAFADQDRVAAILEAAGWTGRSATPVDFTYRAGAGDDPVADALSFLKRIGPAASILRAADPAERPRLLDAVRAVVERYRCGDAVDFPAAAWIWSAKA